VFILLGVRGGIRSSVTFWLPFFWVELWFSFYIFLLCLLMPQTRLATEGAVGGMTNRIPVQIAI
jgi:hypothetical protein